MHKKAVEELGSNEIIKIQDTKMKQTIYKMTLILLRKNYKKPSLNSRKIRCQIRCMPGRKDSKRNNRKSDQNDENIFRRRS